MSMIRSRPRIHWSDFDDRCATRAGALCDVRLARRVRPRSGRHLRRALAYARARRPSWVLLLPPGRAPRDGAVDGSLAEPVLVGCRPTHATDTPGPAEL